MINEVKFKKKLFSEIASISVSKLIIMMLINIASYLTPLAFIYFITESLYHKNSSYIDEINLIILFFIIVVSYLLNILTLQLELNICKIWCEKFKLLLLSKHFNSTDDEVVKVSTISFNILLDNFFKSLSYYFMPIIIVIILIVLCFFLGYLAFYSLLLMFLFLPLSVCLARKSATNYSSILAMSKERVLEFKRWSRYAPYKIQLFNMGLCKDVGIDDIESKLKLENMHRSLDTALRGVDGYLIGFGRLMPLIILSLFGFSVSTLNEKDTTIFLWLCIPTLQLILSLPSTYTAKKMVDKSLSDLNSLIESNKCNENITPRDYMGWPVWSGSIQNLIPFMTDINEDFARTMLTKFRLIPEIGDNLDQVLDYAVSIDGQNLSSGQLVRLKIIRGFVFSYSKNKPFHLIDSLDNLDHEIYLSIAGFVNDYNLSLNINNKEDKNENAQ